MSLDTDQRGLERCPDALARALEIAQGSPLDADILYTAAQPFDLHRGAVFIEFAWYVERETGVEIIGH